MEKFAGYGFNKSHSAAYALIAYQTAYLKAHFPAEFMAANLSAVMDDTGKVQQFHDDARANGLTVLAPDVNSGEYRFVPVAGRQIRYGLGAVKGTGEGAIASIVAARATGGPFADLMDFCRRVDRRLVNRRAIESLIRAGAFDAIDDHRARLLAMLGTALEGAEQAAANASQARLFGDTGKVTEAPRLAEVRRWDTAERLQNEKLALGFYLSGHPFESHAVEIRALVPSSLKDLKPQPGQVTLAGIVRDVRRQTTRRGFMAFITLDDATANVEVAVFSEVFERCRAAIKEDALLVVRGKVQYRGGEREDAAGEVRVSAEEIFDLDAARAQFARSLCLSVNGQANAARLKEILLPHLGGNCPVRVSYTGARAACDLELGASQRVRLTGALLRSLTDWLAEPNVRVEYH